MTCIADQAPLGYAPSRKASLWHKLSRAFIGRKAKRGARLDPRELSAHMKRDLGFLDGRS